MATIKKYGKLWRVQIRRRGLPPKYKAFDNRADADAWARQVEAEIDRGAYVSRVEAERTPISELIDRYEREITPTKRCARAEGYCLRVLKAEFGGMYVAQLRPQDVAAFRDKRLKRGLAGGTIIKDLNTLAHIIQTARREWGINLSPQPQFRHTQLWRLRQNHTALRSFHSPRGLLYWPWQQFDYPDRKTVGIKVVGALETNRTSN